MILIDSNVFMYAAGARHEHKQPSLAFLARVADGEVEAAVDAEILQEILHRYRSIGRWSAGQKVYDLVRRIVPTVFPVSAEILDAARSLMDRHGRLFARDAVHAAVAQAYGVEEICSYDRDFDAIDGLRRIEPEP